MRLVFSHWALDIYRPPSFSRTSCLRLQNKTKAENTIPDAPVQLWTPLLAEPRLKILPCSGVAFVHSCNVYGSLLNSSECRIRHVVYLIVQQTIVDIDDAGFVMQYCESD